jgi:peptide/nickel transport system permease protein
VGLYLVRRIGQSLVALVGISLVTFLLVQLVPGDPARAILGPRAPLIAVAALRRSMGLDRALPAQYGSFLVHALGLNFGYSSLQHASVGSLLWPRLGTTLLLTLYATVVSVVVALPLALASALSRNRPLDHSIRLVTMVTFAMPAFWLGLVLILFFAVKIAAFPASGYGDGFLGHLYSLTLPAIALGLGLAPLLVRTLRGSLIETMSREFVEAARARGYREARVLRRYVLRNSLVASITVVGVNVGYILSIVVVIENVFALPGLGQLLVTSVQNRDFPVVQGIALVLGTIVVLVNLVTDLCYSALDPRIRFSGHR